MTIIDAIVAAEFFKQWAEFSKEALKILAPRCKPITGKTRKWKDPDGPAGLTSHYTGGPNGIASIRWSNENPDNTNSSWHCTIFDHLLSQLEALLDKYPLVKEFLPATAILHARLTSGTWHACWLNSRCFGAELRNLGRLTKRGEKIYRAAGRRKYYPKDPDRIVQIRGIYWEAFTTSQLISEVNIGRMLRAWRGEAFDPCYVIPHSAGWASKSDSGAAHPMMAVRSAIFSDPAIAPEAFLLAGDEGKLAFGPPSGETVEWVDDEVDFDDADADRELAHLEIPEYDVEAVDFDEVVGTNWREFLNAVRRDLSLLGYHTLLPEASPPQELEPELKEASRIFQRSTHTKAYGGAALKVDGIPGAKTRSGIERRLRWFGYKV